MNIKKSSLHFKYIVCIFSEERAMNYGRPMGICKYSWLLVQATIAYIMSGIAISITVWFLGFILFHFMRSLYLGIAELITMATLKQPWSLSRVETCDVALSVFVIVFPLILKIIYTMIVRYMRHRAFINNNMKVSRCSPITFTDD